MFFFCFFCSFSPGGSGLGAVKKKPARTQVFFLFFSVFSVFFFHGRKKTEKKIFFSNRKNVCSVLFCFFLSGGDCWMRLSYGNRQAICYFFWGGGGGLALHLLKGFFPHLSADRKRGQQKGSTSKNVKKCQIYFSTLFAQGKKRRKVSKT